MYKNTSHQIFAQSNMHVVCNLYENPSHQRFWNLLLKFQHFLEYNIRLFLEYYNSPFFRALQSFNLKCFSPTILCRQKMAFVVLGILLL
jgi:hypothetical protein